MNVLNPCAAGIYVGSRSHFVGVGQGVGDVKEFDVYSSDHDKMIDYLKEHKITNLMKKQKEPALYIDTEVH